MDANISSLIEQFAKQNKTSREKLTSLVEQCLSSTQSNCTSQAGRKPKASSVDLRSLLRSMKTQLPAQGFTVKSVAHTLNIPHIDVANAVMYLAKKEGMFVKQGYAKVGCSVGRPECVWKVV